MLAKISHRENLDHLLSLWSLHIARLWHGFTATFALTTCLAHLFVDWPATDKHLLLDIGRLWYEWFDGKISFIISGLLPGGRLHLMCAIMHRHGRLSTICAILVILAAESQRASQLCRLYLLTQSGLVSRSWHLFACSSRRWYLLVLFICQLNFTSSLLGWVFALVSYHTTAATA